VSLRVEARGETTSLAERKRRAGQRLVLGLSGPGITDEEHALIRQVKPAGFILFARNVEEPAQVRELNRELATLVPKSHPALLTVDQEGGRVQRVKDGATLFPPLRWVGNCDDLALTRRFAQALAREVLACGFNVNWAPDADVDSNPKNPVIGDRSFGRDPERVAAHVAAYVQATHDAGLMACVKHFPGHGDTDQDSHLHLPTVEKELPDLERCERRPFEAAIRAGVGLVMTAHVVFPALDEDHPATMSSAVLRGWLREALGFGGVIVSDDMEMKAVRGRFPLEQQLDLACQASLDLFLCCKEPHLQLEAYEQLVRLQEQDPRHDDLAELSEGRVMALRERFLLGRPSPPPLTDLKSAWAADLAHLIRARGQG